VPPGRDPRTVQRFGSFTADLHRLAKWLVACRVETVVMQATGVYWVALLQGLQDYGLDVQVVNAQHPKMLPGRKTEVQECQWLQKLHTFGLLNHSFRPAEATRVLRSYLRQRENLVISASICVQHMQKALTEMNVQLANVISDLTGVTGMAILRALVAGERNLHKLAQLKHQQIHATPAEIVQSLEGNWREELIFVLGQSLICMIPSGQDPGMRPADREPYADHGIQGRCLGPSHAPLATGAEKTQARPALRCAATALSL
jgi:transposase